jgi:hypothetical protein
MQHGARKRVELGAGPKNPLSSKNIYKIYHELKKESTIDYERKFKSELLGMFKSYTFKDEDKKITMDENEKIDLIKKIFDDLNTPDLQSHAKRLYDDGISDGITRFSPLNISKTTYKIPPPPHITRDPERVPFHLKLLRIFIPKYLTPDEEKEQRKCSIESNNKNLRTYLMLQRSSMSHEVDISKNINHEKPRDYSPILIPSPDEGKEKQEIVMFVEKLKGLKKNAITEKLKIWYANNRKEDEAKATYTAYENYANASEQDKLALKAIVLSKLTGGDYKDLSRKLEALKFLKILDQINEYHDASIASYQKRAKEKAKQEEPNEIIKFIIDIPSNILKAFDCIGTEDSKKRKNPSKTP